jgi:hypothetical protein
MARKAYLHPSPPFTNELALRKGLEKYHGYDRS